MTAETMPRKTRLRAEILLVLTVTFGMSGLRSVLRLIDDLLAEEALNEQQVTLNVSQSEFPWLDLALQLCSAGVLFAWGGLALFLLIIDGVRIPRWRWSDLGWGAVLAAVIGLPASASTSSPCTPGYRRWSCPPAWRTRRSKCPCCCCGRWPTPSAKKWSW